MPDVVMRRLRWADMDESARAALCARGLGDIFDPALRQSIGALIDDVRERGDVAVCEALAAFDGITVRPDELRVTAGELEAATVSPAVDTALDDAIDHCRAFNEQLMSRAVAWSFEPEPGLRVGEKVGPIASAGLFVPSGKASYPSVAYQLGVPATVAGVPDIVLVVPPIPGGGGAVDPAVLVVCRKLGITDVFRVNGPAGLAALAFGTESIPRVRKIVGPGSPAVTCAQVELQRHGVVTMMVLGPTESLVIADGSADPVRLAADLLIEAEHGTDSAVVLVTTSADLAAATDAELSRQLADLPAVRADAARSSLGANGGCVLVDDLDDGRRRRQPLRPRAPAGGRRRRRGRRRGRRAGQRRRDPRRSAHPVQRRQLRHRLSGLAADVWLRRGLLRDHRRGVPQAHGDRPCRRRAPWPAWVRRSSPSPTTRASPPTPPPSAAARAEDPPPASAPQLGGQGAEPAFTLARSDRRARGSAPWRRVPTARRASRRRRHPRRAAAR